MDKKTFFNAVKKLPKYSVFRSNADVHIYEKYEQVIANKKTHEQAMKCALGYASNILEEEIQENEDGCNLTAMKKTNSAIRELGNKIFGHSQW